MSNIETLTEQPISVAPISREDFILKLISDFNSGEAKLSYSALSKFKRSPKSFIDYKIEKSEQTDAMLLGSVVHCLVLEPKQFANKYISDKNICEDIGGAKPRATTKYKEWKASQENITVISEDVYITSKLMADAVLNNEASKWVLSQCNEFETKVEFNYNGISFISYLDAKGNVLCDLKICADAEPKKFQRDIVNMNYHLQAGTYTVANAEVLPYFIIAVDRNCGVSVHELEEDFVTYGMDVFNKLVNEFKECLANNEFHKSFEYRSQTDKGTYIMSKPPYLS